MRTFNESVSKIEESKKYLAGGVSSFLRGAMKPIPLFVKTASGSHVIDADGNDYIDYLLAYGPLILGHADPELTEKTYQAMKSGNAYGLQHDGEILLSKRLTEVLPCADKVTFSGSGTEAVMLALRLARAYTNRQKVIRFHGHYHGWSDAIFTSFPSPDLVKENSDQADRVLPGTSGQSESSLQDIILLPWNDPEALKQALDMYGEQIAAIITEPVMCNSGCILPKPGYLEQMREWTQELGIVLIFDEVITGFRLGIGGAHGRFNIKPDLVTMGKAVAGGVPLSVVAGKEEIMDLVATGRVNHLGTMNGNTMVTAAGLATIDILSKNNNAVFEKMERLTQNLVSGLRDVMLKNGVRGVINQIGPVFHMMFIQEDEVRDFATFQKRDAAKYSLFAEKMLDEGILVRPTGLWYVSAVHSDEDIQRTIEGADRVLQSME
ncbi:aspartate aminotransferase family protein [Ammoniphilus resinae]|uniref:Glutamate-1-semialdehyde 2,1-aminomutase n=1 Tax=Ammoniphilus resinae TaxID=861532 RepID=A0ABS4GSU7_9BACL|nr:glutamate-1-semialdehyde 2,1-aminomutase [Ammoniphilus resinae]MBP1933326.1 glutamate-1-semialdehyde 2,1-aminomutase [Ammoniphilus resinae]